MQENAVILSNIEIAKDIWRMEIKTEVAKTAKPGQFIEISVPGFYLRRPISISEIKTDSIIIIYKIYEVYQIRSINILKYIIWISSYCLNYLFITYILSSI